MTVAKTDATIDRANLILATETAIQLYQEEHPDEPLSEAARERLLNAALTMDRVPLSAWRREGCGCVVGTAYSGELADVADMCGIDGPDNNTVEDKLGAALLEIGLTIDRLVHQAIQHHENMSDWVQVIV